MGHIGNNITLDRSNLANVFCVAIKQGHKSRCQLQYTLPVQQMLHLVNPPSYFRVNSAIPSFFNAGPTLRLERLLLRSSPLVGTIDSSIEKSGPTRELCGSAGAGYSFCWIQGGFFSKPTRFMRIKRARFYPCIHVALHEELDRLVNSGMSLNDVVRTFSHNTDFISHTSVSASHAPRTPAQNKVELTGWVMMMSLTLSVSRLCFAIYVCARKCTCFDGQFKRRPSILGMELALNTSVIYQASSFLLASRKNVRVLLRL
ncbi:hypothetical protein C8Q75DRAFT_321430 [Abortiporus biennis]|nr:hypothetical protein C8Q75DRAFT_321430 [Abortiporus biennis]